LPAIKKDVLLNNHSKNSIYKTAVWAIITIGVFLRLFHYFNNRSLWEDEIYLSTGIVKLHISQLVHQSLDFQQKAPIGYLLVVKIFTMIFGPREMGLRLFPLICGIASLFVFWKVARYFFGNLGVLVCVGILALAPPLVYHSVEAKQYAVELFATILLLYTYTRYNKRADIRSLFIWGLWGAVIAWFSYSSVFIMAGLAFTMGLNYLIKKEWKTIFKLAVPFAIWFGSFAVNYIIFTQKDAHTGWLVYFFVNHDAFMPLSGDAVRWLMDHFAGFFNYPLGLSWIVEYKQGIFHQLLYRMAWVPIIFSLLGIYYLLKNDRKLLVLIVSTFLIVFAASVIKLYPFHERLTVFLAPLVILLLAAGCEVEFTGRIFKNAWRWALVLLMLTGPAENSFAAVFNTGLFGDYKKSYHREAFTYLNNHFRPGDTVYVYWNDLPAWRFYKRVYPFKYSAFEGTDFRYISHNFNEYFAKLDTEIKPFMGKKRVWVVSNNNFDIEIGDYIGQPQWYYVHDDGVQRFNKWLLGKGKVLGEFKINDPGAVSNISVRLMDLSGNR
jgi:4-amino-4-deoxy-L-arabinose transferase-like glycosyltransferase